MVYSPEILEMNVSVPLPETYEKLGNFIDNLLVRYYSPDGEIFVPVLHSELYEFDRRFRNLIPHNKIKEHSRRPKTLVGMVISDYRNSGWIVKVEEETEIGANLIFTPKKKSTK